MRILTASDAAKAVVRRNTEEVQGKGNFDVFEGMNPRKFFVELKRRHVYRVAIAYGVVAWLLIQIAISNPYPEGGTVKSHRRAMVAERIDYEV